MTTQFNLEERVAIRDALVERTAHEHGPRARAALLHTMREDTVSLARELHEGAGLDLQSPDGQESLRGELNIGIWQNELRSLDRNRVTSWMGLVTKGLPQFPDLERPKISEYSDIRRYRILPHLTLLGVIALITAIGAILPNLLLSPVTAAEQAVPSDGTDIGLSTWILLGFGGLCLSLLILVGPKRFYEVLLEGALDEEIHFRLGSETWTPWQRVRSCLQFGAAHVMNLIVAVLTLGLLSLVGAIYMCVYLRELKVSGDPRRAAVTAAYFHADYNVGAFAWLMFGATLRAVTLVVQHVL